jgi:hypothetical protein
MTDLFRVHGCYESRTGKLFIVPQRSTYILNILTQPKASRDVGLEINAEKTKYMIMSRHPNSGQNQNIRIANELFENVSKFKYLGTTLTNKNDIHEEIKNRLNSGKAYYSAQNFCLPSHIKKT